MNNTVTQQQIDEIIANGKVVVMKLGEKTTLVKFTSKEGFEIIGTSACVSAENYNEEIGKGICLERIKNKLWAFEGYCLQKELYNASCLTAKERAEIELKQLTYRTDKLNAFVNKCNNLLENGEPIPVSGEQFALLGLQLGAMSGYKSLLKTRLEKWED